MLIEKETHGIYDRIGEEENYNWMRDDENYYFVDSYSDLARKIRETPFFDCVEDENGQLIDIEPKDPPFPLPEPEPSLEEQVKEQQKTIQEQQEIINALLGVEE